MIVNESYFMNTVKPVLQVRVNVLNLPSVDPGEVE